MISVQQANPRQRAGTRESSMSARSAAHASSMVRAGRRGHDHHPVEALGLGNPDRLDLDQATVAPADVVLAIVHHRAPAGPLERTTIHRFDALDDDVEVAEPDPAC